jgi:hypothetical protein
MLHNANTHGMSFYRQHSKNITTISLRERDNISQRLSIVVGLVQIAVTSSHLVPASLSRTLSPVRPVRRRRRWRRLHARPHKNANHTILRTIKTSKTSTITVRANKIVNQFVCLNCSVILCYNNSIVLVLSFTIAER